MHHGGVLNARKTASLENSSVEVQFRGGKYLHDLIQEQVSSLYLPNGLESVCRVTGTEEKKGKAWIL